MTQTSNINFKALFFLVVFNLLFVAQSATSIAATSGSLSENKIKAGLIFNFINFTRWPEATFENSDMAYTICIADKEDYPDIFNIITTQTIHARKIQIQKIDSSATRETVKACQILFVLLKNQNDKNKILKITNSLPILTIAESDEQEDSPAMINLVKDNEMIGFTINRQHAKESEIEFSSKMLRLAINVIGGN